MSKDSGTRPAPHVQKAIARGAQAKVADGRQRVVAPHVQAAMAAGAQAKIAGGARPDAPARQAPQGQAPQRRTFADHVNPSMCGGAAQPMKGGPGSGGREVAMHVQVALKSLGTAQPRREGPGAHGGRSTIQRSRQMLISDFFGGGRGNSGGNKQNLIKPISSSSEEKENQVSVRLQLVFSIDPDIEVGDLEYDQFRLYVDDLEVDPPHLLRTELNNIIQPNSLPTLCSHINGPADIIGQEKRIQLIDALSTAYDTNAVEIEDELEEL
jgi:hypothetical protein